MIGHIAHRYNGGRPGHQIKSISKYIATPLPPQYTVDSASEYEYEYYEEDWNQQQNILYEE